MEIISRIIQVVTLVVVLGLVERTYTYFDMLPASNKFKGWLACDIIALLVLAICIGVKLIFR